MTSGFACAQINVALQANGGVATASSTYSAYYPTAATNDGDRKGLNWGTSGGNDPYSAIIEVEAWTAPMMSMYFIHADHLNTPRLITNHLGQAVWRWANDDPFGHNAPNEDPGGLGAFTCNLRLPGRSSTRRRGCDLELLQGLRPLHRQIRPERSDRTRGRD